MCLRNNSDASSNVWQPHFPNKFGAANMSAISPEYTGQYPVFRHAGQHQRGVGHR